MKGILLLFRSCPENISILVFVGFADSEAILHKTPHSRCRSWYSCFVGMWHSQLHMRSTGQLPISSSQNQTPGERWDFFLWSEMRRMFTKNVSFGTFETTEEGSGNSSFSFLFFSYIRWKWHNVWTVSGYPKKRRPSRSLQRDNAELYESHTRSEHQLRRVRERSKIPRSWNDVMTRNFRKSEDVAYSTVSHRFAKTLCTSTEAMCLLNNPCRF